MNLLQDFQLSVNTLSIDEKAFLDSNGYLNLGKLLTDQQVDQINFTLQKLMDMEGENAGAELLDSKYIKHPKELGADRLADLVNKGEIFDAFYTHPKVLAGIAHVLGNEIKLSSLNYRAAKPGLGLQKLHVDWHETVLPGQYKVCNSIWLLDDFSKANGATRIVPGTHLSGELPQNVLADQEASHPNEVIIEAPAGTVFIFNSHAWHGGTTNATTKSRKAIHSYFCQADQPQQVDQSRYIKKETLQRLSPSAIKILGIRQDVAASYTN